MQREENISFRSEENPARIFRLETIQDDEGHRRLTLWVDNQRVSKLTEPSLRLLRLLATNYPNEVPNAIIRAKIWPTGVNSDIDKAFQMLRNALGDSASDPKIISVIPRVSHKFLVPIKRTGDLGGVEAYEEWIPAIYEEFMRKLQPDSKQREDLRIATTAFSGSAPDLKLVRHVKRGLRIKILMMNPSNTALAVGRYSLRQDKYPEDALGELNSQIQTIKRNITQIQELHAESHEELTASSLGSLELRLSDLVPCGFLAQSAKRAVFGIFPTHASYSDGPMLDIRSDSGLWMLLKKDWDARWDHAGQKSELCFKSG